MVLFALGPIGAFVSPYVCIIVIFIIYALLKKYFFKSQSNIQFGGGLLVDTLSESTIGSLIAPI